MALFQNTTLERLGEAHGTDKFHHGYLPHYEQHFMSLRGEPISLLEIGVYHGGSLALWADYFYNVCATIVGIDIDPACATIPFGDERIKVTIGDVKQATPNPNGYDIIIDDGSHSATDVLYAFTKYWPLITPGGWYVIEDFEVHWIAALNDGLADALIATTDEMLHRVLRGTDGEITTIHQKRAADDSPPSISELHAYEQILFMRKAD